jgi:KaiC/GvpD/RAD55 family RecA-like ATPase
MPRLAFIEDLTTGPVPLGSQILVEYDSMSVWFNASLNAAAGWLRTGGRVEYETYAQAPEDLRSRLKRIEPRVDDYEVKDAARQWDSKFTLWDGYSVTLGQKSKEKYAVESLKVSDLSLIFSQIVMRGTPPVGTLLISDDFSVLSRFNDEKNWVEFELTRQFPAGKLQIVTHLYGLLKGVQSEWAYKRLEAASDGVIEFKVDDASDPPRSLVRIRSMRSVGFDGRWHQLNVNENLEVSLAK